jgi:predicted RNA-binding Zn ribbon-like protein
MAVRRWSWLGNDLAVDFANTVRRRGRRYVDLITGPVELGEWLARQGGRIPVPSVVDEDAVGRVIGLRDLVLRMLRAAATGAPSSMDDRAALNGIVLRHPAVRLLTDTPRHAAIRPLVPDDDQVAALLAVLAAATVELLSRPDLAGIALCDAPGCGQLYHRARPNQQWCTPHCGARVRSERHQERSATG